MVEILDLIAFMKIFNFQEDRFPKTWDGANIMAPNYYLEISMEMAAQIFYVMIKIVVTNGLLIQTVEGKFILPVGENVLVNVTEKC